MHETRKDGLNVDEPDFVVLSPVQYTSTEMHRNFHCINNLGYLIHS